MVTNEPIQTKEPKPLPIKLEDIQPIKFEPINNHLTHGSIKGTYVHVQDSNVTIRNDQNDAFSEALIDVYILEAYNPKGRVYS